MRTQAWIVTVFSLIAVPAFAQSPDDRVRLSFGAGMTAGAIDGEASISGSAGYRFAKNLSFEVEVTAADESTDRFAVPFFVLGNIANIGDVGRGGNGRNDIRNVGLQNVMRLLPATATFPVPIEGFDEGSTFMTTAGFRYEIPFEGTRFRPYLSAGMGIARTEQTINLAVATTATSSASVGRGGANVVSSTNTVPGFDGSFSHTGMMGSAGIGASVRVFKGLSADLNARFFLLDRDRQLGSFGGGVSYRF
jgi:hypothetical protein